MCAMIIKSSFICLIPSQLESAIKIILILRSILRWTLYQLGNALYFFMVGVVDLMWYLSYLISGTRIWHKTRNRETLNFKRIGT